MREELNTQWGCGPSFNLQQQGHGMFPITHTQTQEELLKQTHKVARNDQWLVTSSTSEHVVMDLYDRAMLKNSKRYKEISRTYTSVCTSLPYSSVIANRQVINKLPPGQAIYIDRCGIDIWQLQIRMYCIDRKV